MEITNIYYTSKFAKNFKRLPRNIKETALKKEVIFRKDFLNPSLKTHKLTGTLAGCYSFSISYSYRILFILENSKTAVFLDVGTHSIYE